MLTYHVAAHAPKGTLAGIVGMTFLDQRIPKVAHDTAHDPITAAVGPAMPGALAKTPLRGLRYPMTIASKMSALANYPRPPRRAGRRPRPPPPGPGRDQV